MAKQYQDRNLVAYHSKKYHGHGILHSKKHSNGHHYWRTDSRDGLAGVLMLPFVPIVPMMFVGFAATQCTCFGGPVGEIGNDELCDCSCYCNSVNPDFIPVVLEEGETYDIEPDVINEDSKTCGCVAADVFQPVAQSDTFFTEVGTPITFNPVANDIDINNEPLSIMSFEQPNNGLVVENFDGTLTYTPDADFEGIDLFDYVISNQSGGFGTGTTSIVVGNPSGISGITTQATPLTISPNDILGDGLIDLVPLDEVVQPINGALSWGEDGNLLYTPDPDFLGTDTFQFTVLDSDGNTSFLDGSILVQPVAGGGLGELSIGGNDVGAPKTENDSFITNLDTALKLSPSDILSNDLGIEVRLQEIFQPLHGSITEGPNGSFIYTPNPGFSGTDTFAYTVTDNSGKSSSGEVTIIVNRLPSVVADSFSTRPNRPLTINKEQVLGNDSDPDGDILAIESNTKPSNGRVVLRPLIGGFLYTPNNGFVGIDSFEYIVSDGNGGFGKATITITVADELTAVNDNYSTAAYTELTIDSPGVLDNDVGFGLQVLTFRQPQNGAVFVATDGAMTYAPNSYWHGVDTFFYTIIDSSGASSTASVTILVEPVPLSPGISPGGPSNAPGLCRRYTTDTNMDSEYAINCDYAYAYMQGHHTEGITIVDGTSPEAMSQQPKKP